MKLYKDRIFMGNGDTSMAECYALVRDLQRALSNISAIQQLGVSSYSENQDQIEDMEDFVQSTAQNIYTALTGVRFSRKGEIILMERDNT